MNIYEHKPVLENDVFLIREIQNSDFEDLFSVYSDKNALPYFNSDNCDGDIFYYSTREKMNQALAFWKEAYENRWFARLAVEDKILSEVIGTVEFCLRVSDDEFNQSSILRVDVRSDYEVESKLVSVLTLAGSEAAELVGGKNVITKIPVYAVERINAAENAGFKKSDSCLIGKNGDAYDNYWVLSQ